MSAYCETCAAIGNDYWNQRLFLLHGDAKYIDVMERTLFNGLIDEIVDSLEKAKIEPKAEKAAKPKAAPKKKAE